MLSKTWGGWWVKAKLSMSKQKQIPPLLTCLDQHQHPPPPNRYPKTVKLTQHLFFKVFNSFFILSLLTTSV